MSLFEKIFCDVSSWCIRFCEKVTIAVSFKVLHPLVFKFRQQLPQPYSDVCVMLAQSELLADVAAYYVMPLLLYVFAHILSLEPQSVQAAVAGLPIGKPFLLQI